MTSPPVERVRETSGSGHRLDYLDAMRAAAVSLVVVMQQRAVTLTRLRVGRRRSRLFHQILGESAHAVVDVALFGVQLQL